jgi:hypothetical protein
MNLKNIWIQGSMSFHNYLRKIERIYNIRIKISGYDTDNYYNLIPIDRGQDFALDFKDKSNFSDKDKTIICFKEFEENYSYTFEYLLTEISNKKSYYSII